MKTQILKLALLVLVSYLIHLLGFGTDKINFQSRRIELHDTILDLNSDNEIFNLYIENMESSFLVNDTCNAKSSIVYCLKENYISLANWYRYRFNKSLGNTIVFRPLESDLKLNYIKISLKEELKLGNYEIVIFLSQNNETTLTLLKELEYSFKSSEIEELKEKDLRYNTQKFNSIFPNGEFDLFPFNYYGLGEFVGYRSSQYSSKGNENFLYIGIFNQDIKTNKYIVNEFDTLGQINFESSFYKKKYSFFVKNPFAQDNISANTFLPYLFIKRIILIRKY
jgi:hypothetical protein